MTELLRIAFVLFLALNVAAVAARLPTAISGLPTPTRAAMFAAGMAVALGVVGLLGALHEPLLDALDVEPETFRVAAGVIAALGGLRVVAAPRRTAPAPNGWAGALVPLAFPLLLTPELAALSVSYGADEGVGVTLSALAVAGLAGWAAGTLLAGTRDAWHRTLVAGAARFAGAVLAVAGVGLVVDGVRSI